MSKPDEIMATELPRNTALISIDYGKTMGSFWISTSQKAKWVDAITSTKASALSVLIRVHDLEPDSALYASLLKAGVDMIGTKNLLGTYRILSTLH